jgi:MscS family membrane protein
MKWRYQWVYRVGLAILCATAFWAVYASAQEAPATNAPAATAGTPLTFDLDHVGVLRNLSLLDEPLWKYLASLIYVVLAFGVAKFLDYLVHGWLRRLAAGKKSPRDELLLELLHGPVKMVALVIFLHIGLSLFDWPEHAQLLLSRGLIVLVAWSVTYLTLKLVDLLLGLWEEQIVAPQDKLFAKQLIPLASKMAKSGLVIAGVIITAENLDIKITSALAGLSVGGLALGLAAQDTVANLFGAVAIFLDKPFYLGDMIRVEGVEGVVEGIGLRSTRVRNLDGHHVSIPNKLMGNAIITNITRRPTIRSEINLGLTYDLPAKKVARAVALLEQIYRSHPRTADLIISFNKFGDSALNILVVHVWAGTDLKEHFAGLQALNLQIKERFDAEKIEFAYPTQTVFLRQEANNPEIRK